jgi:methyl-accepting chemotaxis protein
MAAKTYSAGTAWLQVVPSFRDVEDALGQEAAKLGKQIEKTLGGALPKGMAEGARRTRSEAEKAGTTYGGNFGKTAVRQIEAAWKALPEPTLKMNKFDQQVQQVRKQLRSLYGDALAGNIDESRLISGVESAADRLRFLQGNARGAQNFFNTRDAGRALESFLDIADDAARKGAQAGAGFGGAFADQMQRTIEDAISSLPAFPIRANGREARDEIARIRDELVRLSARTIGVDVDPGQAFAALTRIRAQLAELSAREYDVDVEIKMASDVAGGKIGRALGEDARRQGDQAGAAFVGAFDAHLKTSLASAIQAIPDITLTADMSDAQRLLGVLRAQLQELSEKTINVDIDATDAYGEFLRLHAALRDLEAQDVELDVRVNAASAADGMARLANETDEASRSMRDMDGNAKLTISRLGIIIGLSASFGSVFVPGALAAAAAVGTIGTLALGSVAGVGVLALGLNGISDAVGALNKADQDADKTARSLSQAHNAVRKAADGVATAEANLGRTREQVNESAADAARRVEKAEEAVADARRKAAREARDAARDIVDAQRSVTDAEEDAVEVRKGLNEAYKEAARNLEDLKSKQENNALDQRKATTEILKAKEELDKIINNPRATEVERRTARETYDERVQQLKDLQLEGKQLGQDLADANKKGLEGSDEVVAVRKRIADADDRVRAAQERLSRAQERAAERQADSNERIADAQEQVAEAQRAQARQARDGAYQIQQASKGVRDARLAERDATEALGVAGGEAIRNLEKSMDSLSPAGRRFAKFLFGLKDEVIGLRDAAQENLLPGLQEAITMGLPALPALEEFIGKVARKVGDLAVQSAKAFGGSTWQRFFDYVDQTAVPSLQTVFDIGSDVAEGMVALYLALTPFNSQVGGGLTKLAQDFATWAKELDRSQGYRDFLEYVDEHGPEVVELLGNFGVALVNIVKAAMPLGAIMLDVTNAILEFVDAIPGPILTTLVTTLGLVALGILGISAAIRVGKFKRELSDIFGPPAQKMVQTYAIDTGRATTETGKFGKAMATAGGAAEKARGKFKNAGSSLAGIVDFATGPVGLSIAAVTAYIGAFGQKTAEQKARVETLSNALGALNDEFRDLRAEGKTAGDAADLAFKKAVQSNPKLQEAVKTLTAMGVSVEELIRASTSGDPSVLVKKLNDEIERQQQLTVDAKNKGGDKEQYENAKRRIIQLTDMRDAVIANSNAIGLQADATRILNQQTTQAVALENYRREHPYATPAEIQAQTDAYTRNSDRVNVLTDLVAAYSTGQNDAGAKAAALKNAIDLQTGSLIAAEEAGEAWNSQLLSLSDSVKANGTTLDANTREGLSNRDAIQAAAKAARDFYLEEIASGKPIEKVTGLHKDRITQLKAEAQRLGIASTETDRLIDLYGDVPEDVKTLYKTDGFDKVYNELSQLKFIQEALNKGWTIERAKKEWSKLRETSLTPGPTMGPPKKADGGRITGPGTGTSDDVLMYGSNGEWVHRAAAVGYYGDDFMSAINNMEIPKEWLPGFSTGGKVGGGDGASQIPGFAKGGKILNWDAVVPVGKTLIPAIEDLANAIGGFGGSGDLGGAGGDRGWRWQMKVLRDTFPGLDLYSGFRKNSYTSSGSLSWHSRDGGRAVDIPPRQDVFDFIHNKYGKNTKELIWGGDPNRNIYRGDHHRFSDSLLYRHGPYKGKRGPSPHVHWAFDEGGWMMPGMPSMNLLREPEPVLTPWQWDAIENFVNQGMAGGGKGDTYNFEFADTTLTPDRLSAIQQRQDALARVGRPR